MIAKTTLDSVTVETVNMLSGETVSRTFSVPPFRFISDFTAWKGGRLIQDAFPYLSSADREFLISGLDEQAWEESMGEQE